jgi:hypothetical protein
MPLEPRLRLLPIASEVEQTAIAALRRAYDRT